MRPWNDRNDDGDKATNSLDDDLFKVKWKQALFRLETIVWRGGGGGWANITHVSRFLLIRWAPFAGLGYSWPIFKNICLA